MGRNTKGNLTNAYDFRPEPRDRRFFRSRVHHSASVRQRRCRPAADRLNLTEKDLKQ